MWKLFTMHLSWMQLDVVDCNCIHSAKLYLFLCVPMTTLQQHAVHSRHTVFHWKMATDKLLRKNCGQCETRTAHALLARHQSERTKRREFVKVCIAFSFIAFYVYCRLRRNRPIYEPPRFMTVNTAIEQLLEAEATHGQNILTDRTLAIGVARVGTDSQQVVWYVRALFCNIQNVRSLNIKLFCIVAHWHNCLRTILARRCTV